MDAGAPASIEQLNQETDMCKPSHWARLAAIALLSLCGAAVAADKPSGPALKFNWGAPTADYFTLYVAKDLGLFEQANLEPQFFFFQSGAPLIAGLKSESLDVVTTGLATVFALGQNIPLKLIYWELDHAGGEGLVVNPKSGINSYMDIAKAKTIAAPSGTCGQVSLALLAKKVGIKYSTLNVLNIAPPLYANAMASGSLDAGIAWMPYAQSLTEAGYKVVSWDPDFAPEGGVCPGMTAARTKFLQANPDIGVKLVEIHAKSMEAIAKNPELAINALMKYLSVTHSVAKAAYDRESGARYPTLQQQLDPTSQYSMTAKEGGLAKKLHIASQMLFETGTIPATLTWEAINAAVEPAYIRQYLERSPK